MRRDAYAGYIAAVERLDAIVSMYARPVERAAWEDWLYSFRAAQVATQLVESDEVRTARRAFGELFGELAPEVERRAGAGEPMQDALGVAYIQMRDRLGPAGRALSDATRADVAFAPDAPDSVLDVRELDER